MREIEAQNISLPDTTLDEIEGWIRYVLLSSGSWHQRSFLLPSNDALQLTFESTDSPVHSAEIIAAPMQFELPLFAANSESGASQDRGLQPPLNAEWLLCLLLPRSVRDDVLGDLREDFQNKIVPRYGRQRAVLWYWKQVVAAAAPLITYSAARLLRLGLLGWVAERIRRVLGL